MIGMVGIHIHRYICEEEDGQKLKGEKAKSNKQANLFENHAYLVLCLRSSSTVVLEMVVEELCFFSHSSARALCFYSLSLSCLNQI